MSTLPLRSQRRTCSRGSESCGPQSYVGVSPAASPGREDRHQPAFRRLPHPLLHTLLSLWPLLCSHKGALRQPPPRITHPFPKLPGASPSVKSSLRGLHYNPESQVLDGQPW